MYTLFQQTRDDNEGFTTEGFDSKYDYSISKVGSDIVIESFNTDLGEVYIPASSLDLLIEALEGYRLLRDTYGVDNVEQTGSGIITVVDN